MPLGGGNMGLSTSTFIGFIRLRSRLPPHVPPSDVQRESPTLSVLVTGVTDVDGGPGDQGDRT